MITYNSNEELFEGHRMISRSNIKFLEAEITRSAIKRGDLSNKDSSGVTKRISYINYTNYSLYVNERSGLVYPIKPIAERFSSNFIIRQEYYIPINLFDDLTELFSKPMNKDIDSDLITLKDVFLEQKDNDSSKYHGMTIFVDITVGNDLFNQFDEIYLTNADIVVSKKRNHSYARHPFCQGSLQKEKFDFLSDKKGMSISIEIIDNENLISNRYYLLMNTVYKLVPQEDNTRNNGVYLTQIDHVSDQNEPSIITTRYDFKDAEDTLGLYKTIEEARLAGDISREREKELETLQFENKRIALEIKKLEQEHNRIMTDKTQIIRELQLENEKIQADNLKDKMKLEKDLHELKAKLDKEKVERNDHYEERSKNRQESLEITKYLPAIIAAVAAIVIIVVKK